MGMPRGSRGGGFSTRGSSYRGGGRGSWHSSSRGYGSSPRGGGRFNSHNHNSFSSNHSYDRKYSSSSDKYGGARHHVDDYRRSYKPDSGGYSSRDHRSPDRKRMRTDSSHERSFGGGSGGGEYKNRYENDRRSFSHDGRRTPSSYTPRNKDEFRKPAAPMGGSPRGGYRGRGGMSSRGGGALRTRPSERLPPLRKRLVESSSYTVRRRVLKTRPHRQTDYARRLQINKMRSAITRRPKKTSSDNSDEEDEKPVDVKQEPTSDKEEDEQEEHGDEVKSPKKDKKEEVGSEGEEKKESDGEAEKKSSSTSSKLTCPHCSIRYQNSVKYSLHLQSGQHAASMRRVATKQKAILSQMRLVQRKAQRELEKTTDDLAPRTSWCPMCKLNYKQPKATHQASKAHLDMKRFLMPNCKICKITFKSPMIYESHCCSIGHIKRKQSLTERPEKDEVSANEEDLENFMTIDSIGDVDEDGDQVMKDEKKEQVNVGIEEIHKVEVFYCDLCRMYLPRVNDDEEMNKEIARHCKQRTHLQKYIRYKEDKELARKAERLVRKENAEKEKEKSEEKKEVEEKEPEKAEETKADLEDTVDDDKFYELPITAEKGGKSDEEDEDEDSVANGERYDRFRQSEKDEKKEEPAPVEEVAKPEVAPEDTKI